MIDEKRYEEAMDMILAGKQVEGFSAITELYLDGDPDEREGILAILLDAFYAPNLAMLKQNYENNRNALLSYPFWFGPDIPEFADLSCVLFPVSENIFFLFDLTVGTFEQIEVDSKTATKYFFSDLSNPLLVQEETNRFNLNFLADNIRPSEDVGMDNHIYLYYENCQHLYCVMQTAELPELLDSNKFVFLLGKENRRIFDMDPQKLYGIDYSLLPPKLVDIGDIKRLFFGWVIHGFSGASLLAQLIDFHPDVLTHPNDTLEKFFMYKQELAGVVADKIIDSFFVLPTIGAFRADIIKLVCYGKEIKDKEDQDHQVKLFLEVLKTVLRDYKIPSYIQWMKAIILAYNLYNGRELNGRIFPAIFFAPHGYIDREESIRSFCISICQAFSYCNVLIPLRDPIAMSGSIIGCVHMGAMPAPSAAYINYYTFGFYQHFRPKDDPIYKLGTLIRFEDLKLNPKATVSSMIELLNISFAESLLTTTINGTVCGNTHSHIKEFADGLDVSPVYWHIENNEFLNEYDKYRIEMLVSEYYRYFGYEPKFYDGKKYQWDQIERMMQEPMQCDFLDLEKGLCSEQDIKKCQNNGRSFWKTRFDMPVKVNDKASPLKMLKPKSELLQTELYK